MSFSSSLSASSMLGRVPSSSRSNSVLSLKGGKSVVMSEVIDEEGQYPSPTITIMQQQQQQQQQKDGGVDESDDDAAEDHTVPRTLGECCCC